MDRILISFLLLAILFYDLKKMYIPNILNFTLFYTAVFSKSLDFNTIENSIIGMGVYSLPIIFIYGYVSDIVNKEVIGFGDIKLILSLGYILGYKNFYEIYIFYMIIFISGAIFGIILGKLKNNFKIAIPFSPFIILGFYIIWIGAIAI